MKFAAIHWREKSKADGAPVYGRIVSTASESFLFGTPGQPNYGAAKAGIVPLTMGAAKVLYKYGVTANVVLPRARTRMTLQGPTGVIFAKPEEVAYLCTPEAQRVTAHVFLVWGRNVQVLARPEMVASFETDEVWSVESLHQQLGPWFEKKEPIADGYPIPEM
jgi:3-oxoacyl-[acyl-carrier protein] reductase